MKRATARETGNRTLSVKLNEELTPAGDSAGTPTASGALPITQSRLFRLNGAGALAMTVAAPTIAQEGVEIEVVNLSGTGATVTVTGMDVSALADVFTLPAASATSRPYLKLMCRNVGTVAVPSYKWIALMGAGVTVA